MEAELFSNEVVSSAIRVNLLGARYEVDEFGVPIGDQMEISRVVHVAINNYRWKSNNKVVYHNLSHLGSRLASRVLATLHGSFCLINMCFRC